MVDAVAYGRNSDRETQASASGRALPQGALDLPEDIPFPGAEEQGPIPYVFLADEAIPLRRGNSSQKRHAEAQTEGKQVFDFRLSPSGEWSSVPSTL